MFIERVICVLYLCWRELSCAARKADKVSSVAYEDGGDGGEYHYIIVRYNDFGFACEGFELDRNAEGGAYNKQRRRGTYGL